MSTRDAEIAEAPRFEGKPPRVLIVRAPYYRAVVDGMTVAAERVLAEAGATVERLDVAGAYELPQAVRLALRARPAHGAPGFDAYVVLGCVVRGETDHYDYICGEAMAGLMRVSLSYGLAMGTGLLTVDTLAQAEARSGPDRHNKGGEAAVAALLQLVAARRFGGG